MGSKPDFRTPRSQIINASFGWASQPPNLLKELCPLPRGSHEPHLSKSPSERETRKHIMGGSKEQPDQFNEVGVGWGEGMKAGQYGPNTLVSKMTRDNFHKK